MKFLAAVLALLLLTGCTAAPAETQPSSDTSASLHVPGHSLETQTRGILQVYPTEESAFSRVYSMGEDLLLQSGDKLTRFAGSSLTPQVQTQGDIILRADPDGVWVFRQEQVVILDSDFQELQTISLPDPVVGIPGLSADSRYLYYLSTGCLKVLDCSTGLSSLLRDNMAFTDGSVSALEGGLLLLHLTQEDGSGRSLLVSDQDGSTQYADYAPLDAARSSAGLQLVVQDSNSQLALLLTDTGISQLQLHQGETVCCFLRDFAVTAAEETEGMTVRLYSFSSGLLLSEVAMDGIDAVGNGCFSSDGSLYITARDAASGLWWVLRWNYDAFPPESQDSCLTPYVLSADAPGRKKCQALADALEGRYGLRILLFDEAAATAPWDYAFTAAYRMDETQWALENLQDALAAFPDGFLVDLIQGWDDLTICLVAAIDGTAESGSLDSAEGLQFQSGSHDYIALAPSTPESLRYTLFHEFSHLIDTRVLTKCSAYDNWNDLNPQNFAYTLDYNADVGIFTNLLTGENRAFIDAYSMTFPAEDRARIFECASNPGNADLFTTPVLQMKLQRICTAIRQAFGLTEDSRTFVWEQYLEK